MKQRHGPPIRTSESWRNYFEQNRTSPRPIPWQQGATLASVEREQIASSVQEFQLGESSEGRHLLHAAGIYAQREEDPDYLATMRLFIAEEQRHSRELGRFLDLAGIPRRRSTWADSIFRQCRRGGGLERSIVVLVTAEIIATVYYGALREATGSPVLRSICDLILRDEAAHVRFQCERLAILRSGRWRILLAMGEMVHRIFLFAVTVVVWIRHGRAMRAGGLTWRTFRKRIARVFHRSKVFMSPSARQGIVADDENRTDAFTASI